ncbi:MAG: M23 family metallopeptidase [Bacteroidota bacterium]|nr:M23 family metallopeptidase [Bacteroidota bacterium]
MKRHKEKTTVLFVSKNQQSVKPIQISSKIIANWKKYTLAIALFFISLIGIISFLVSNGVKQDKIQVALLQKIKSMHVLFSEVDTAAIREKFTKIDHQLSGINSFLKARGIKTISTDPQGGEEDHDILSTEEIGDFYENYLGKIAYNISYTPLGYPYHGRITSGFGHRENPFGGANVETHTGLDIKGPIGAPVKAMAEGKVEFAGKNGGFGNCIKLKHANGFETLYGHLSKILVNVGQKVDIGQKIGNIGSTGRSTGPHLHYEVHRYGKKINPESFLTLK